MKNRIIFENFFKEYISDILTIKENGCIFEYSHYYGEFMINLNLTLNKDLHEYYYIKDKDIYDNENCKLDYSNLEIEIFYNYDNDKYNEYDYFCIDSYQTDISGNVFVDFTQIRKREIELNEFLK